LHRKPAKARDLLGFLRLDLSLFASFVGVLGFALFNPLSHLAVPVAISSFLACGAGCAYNEMKDMKEDMINRGKVNPFTRSGGGPAIIASSYVLGFLLSSLVSVASLLLYLAMVFLGLTYSRYRLKQYLLVKNFYSGFGSTLVFLIGASSVSTAVLGYYFMLSLFIFAGTIVSDLRDYAGDIKAGVRTIPVAIGYVRGKATACALFLTFLAAMHATGLYMFAPLSAFSLLIMALLVADRPSPAHKLGGISLVSMAGILLV